jgi:hypothetical protein
MLFEIILAANYLDIKPLLYVYLRILFRYLFRINSPDDANLCTYTLHSDVGCKTVANMIKGKSPEEIRKLFNIVNEWVQSCAEGVSSRLLIRLSLRNSFTPEEEAQIKRENEWAEECVFGIRLWLTPPSLIWFLAFSLLQPLNASSSKDRGHLSSTKLPLPSPGQRLSHHFESQDHLTTTQPLIMTPHLPVSVRVEASSALRKRLRGDQWVIPAIRTSPLFFFWRTATLSFSSISFANYCTIRLGLTSRSDGNDQRQLSPHVTSLLQYSVHSAVSLGPVSSQWNSCTAVTVT